MTRPFDSLTPREVLALAIHVERANARRFRSFAAVFRGYEQEVAARFEELAAEEDSHESVLVSRFQERFGEAIPEVEEHEVDAVIESIDVDEGEHLIFNSLQPGDVLRLALRTERGAQQFYRRAVDKAPDASLAGLYRELAEVETDHARWLEDRLAAAARTEEGP